MDCAHDDDQIIVVAMVDFVFSVQIGITFSINSLSIKPFFSHSFDHRSIKLLHKLLYGHFIMDCAFYDDRTIVVAMVDFAISTQFGLIYSKYS